MDTDSVSPTIDYLLGNDETELGRLAFQHRVWAREAYALWERAGFGYGQRLADLGCGPGFATLDLAHLVGPRGSVVAVDGSREFLHYLSAQAGVQGLTNVEPRLADVEQLELPAASLDGAYIRWLLCYLQNPEELVARVAAALKPGGALAVTDYFNYRAFTVAPRSLAMDRVVAAVEEAWRRRGGDLEIQGRLPAMMARHGLKVAHVGSASRVARPGSALWHWPRMFFDGFLPLLLEMELLDEAERDAFERDWRERSADPTAYLCVPPMFDIVGVKR